MTPPRGNDDPESRKLAEAVLDAQRVYQKAVEAYDRTPSELAARLRDEAQRELDARQRRLAALLRGRERD